MTQPVATSDSDLGALRTVVRSALRAAHGDGATEDHASWRTDWKRLTDLGVTAFCVPEDLDGFGRQIDAAVVVAGELGAALHPAPYAGLVASTYALGDTTDPVARDLLTAVMAGETMMAFAVVDPIGGIARLVDGGADADAVLLMVGPDEMLLLTDPSGWSARPVDGFDVSRTCAELTVDPTSGRRMAARPLAPDLHRLLLAADAVGCVQHALDRTVAYAAEREAFGRAIGGTQAVQHRLVDHTVRARGMGLSVGEAARQVMNDTAIARRAVTVAAVGVSRAATHILHDLVQLSGAIGFTWEYGLHSYSRRVHADARLTADPRAALRILVDIEEWST